MLFIKYFDFIVGFMHHFYIITIHIILLLSDICESSDFLQVLRKLNMPCETMSLYDEKADVEHSRKPWNILPTGHNIFKE